MPAVEAAARKLMGTSYVGLCCSLTYDSLLTRAYGQRHSNFFKPSIKIDKRR